MNWSSQMRRCRSFDRGFAQTILYFGLLSAFFVATACTSTVVPPTSVKSLQQDENETVTPVDTGTENDESSPVFEVVEEASGTEAGHRDEFHTQQERNKAGCSN